MAGSVKIVPFFFSFLLSLNVYSAHSAMSCNYYHQICWLACFTGRQSYSKGERNLGHLPSFTFSGEKGWVRSGVVGVHTGGRPLRCWLNTLYCTDDSDCLPWVQYSRRGGMMLLILDSKIKKPPIRVFSFILTLMSLENTHCHGELVYATNGGDISLSTLVDLYAHVPCLSWDKITALAVTALGRRQSKD